MQEACFYIVAEKKIILSYVMLKNMASGYYHRDNYACQQMADQRTRSPVFKEFF
jgi:hypothetical protein